MINIKAKTTDSEDHAVLCSVTNVAFKQVPGISYYYMDDGPDGKQVERPVSPQCANSSGFEFSEKLAPPGSVTNKAALTNWLKGLGLPAGGTHYRKLYGDFAPLYPDLGRNNNGKPINY